MKKEKTDISELEDFLPRPKKAISIEGIQKSMVMAVCKKTNETCPNPNLK